MTDTEPQPVRIWCSWNGNPKWMVEWEKGTKIEVGTFRNEKNLPQEQGIFFI